MSRGLPETDHVNGREGASRDPRVLRSRARILDAAAALLIEGGSAAATIERISERSGVAKTTIYRHWRSRSVLIFDAFESLLTPGVRGMDATGLREGLVAMLKALTRGVTESRWAPAVAALIEAGERDPELAGLVHDFLVERMEPVRDLIEQGKASGQLSAGVDVDVAIGMLAGPIFYRRLVSREPVGPDVAEEIVARFLAGAAAEAREPAAEVAAS